MQKGAKISQDKKYWYQLWRIWDNKLPTIAFIGLNPSYADEEVNDPTINWCIEFTKKWGYGGFYMINLFAFISTDPDKLSKQDNPVGLDNDNHIREIASKVEKVICAWGNYGIIQNRNIQVLNLIKEPYCIKINLSGQPAHPLYLKKELTPIYYKENSKLSQTRNSNQDNNPNILAIDSKFISFQENIDKKVIEGQHWLSVFNNLETIMYIININNGAKILKQNDKIIIGSETIFWYQSRVGKFYTKSNGDNDAEHISQTNIFKHSEVKNWRTICTNSSTFLEIEMQNGERYNSVAIPINEIEYINHLQQKLNKHIQ